jgi:hypothetical protein
MIKATSVREFTYFYIVMRFILPALHLTLTYFLVPLQGCFDAIEHDPAGLIPLAPYFKEEDIMATKKSDTKKTETKKKTTKKTTKAPTKSSAKTSTKSTTKSTASTRSKSAKKPSKSKAQTTVEQTPPPSSLQPRTSFSEERVAEIRKREQITDKVQASMRVAFYRRWWIEDRCDFAREWLKEHDKDWLKKHKDDVIMNQIF